MAAEDTEGEEEGKAAPLLPRSTTVYSTSTSLKKGARGRPGPSCVRILIGGLPTFKKKKKEECRSLLD